MLDVTVDIRQKSYVRVNNVNFYWRIAKRADTTRSSITINSPRLFVYFVSPVNLSTRLPKRPFIFYSNFSTKV